MSTPELDKHGFLKKHTLWDEDTAYYLACLEEIELTPDHWEIIHLVREYYTRYEHSPAMRPLVKFIRLELDEKKASSIYLLKLFPESPARIASRIAGLPKPDHCL